MGSNDLVNREDLRNALYEADAITIKGVDIINNFPAAEHAIVVNPFLASRVGLNESIVLWKLNSLLIESRDSNKNYKDGRYWAPGTFDYWKKQFPFWSLPTIKRTFARLTKAGIVVTGNYNDSVFDRTSWYRIDYSVLRSITKR